MTSEAPRKIKNFNLEIFMPYELDKNKYKILQSIAEDFPVKLNLEGCMEINMNWPQEKV